MSIRKLLLSGLALAGALSAGPALADSTSTASASINILEAAITITKTADLSFGSVVRPTAGTGTVQLDANSGAVSVSGGMTVPSGSSATRAEFSIAGTPNRNINFTYPGSFNLTRTGGSDTLSVSLTSTMGGGQIGSDGTVTVRMGGQLNVASSTPSGAYTGTFTVTVAYN